MTDGSDSGEGGGADSGASSLKRVTAPPSPGTPADWDATYVADLKLRASRREGLCLKEHTINQNDEHDQVWVECAGVELARLKLVRSSQDQSYEIQGFIARVMASHERCVAADIVAALLPLVET